MPFIVQYIPAVFCKDIFNFSISRRNHIFLQLQVPQKLATFCKGICNFRPLIWKAAETRFCNFSSIWWWNQCCGFAWIRIILGCWIRIRIKGKSRIQIWIRIKVKRWKSLRAILEHWRVQSGRRGVVGYGFGSASNWKISSGSGFTSEWKARSGSASEWKAGSGSVSSDADPQHWIKIKKIPLAAKKLTSLLFFVFQI